MSDRNVTFVVGLFNETLLPFLGSTPGRVAFLHIDSDLYTSAKYVLKTLPSRFCERQRHCLRRAGYEGHLRDLQRTTRGTTGSLGNLSRHELLRGDHWTFLQQE